MDLFEIVNGHAFPSVHALLIQPFKDIWERDTSSGKEKAIKIFTYVELSCSPKKSNPFHGYSEEERPKHVKKEVYNDSDYRICTDTLNAIMAYKEFLEVASPSYPLYLSGIKAASTLKDYLNTIDLGERTQSGAMVIKPQDITKALKEIPDVIKSMQSMRNSVQSELIEDSKTRNQREIGLYER